MNEVDEIISQAEQHCKAHGARLTVMRKQVLSGLIQSNKALSAYELIDFCKMTFGNTIPVMTVYRVLDFLEQEYLAHKLNLTKKYVACAHISGEHTHGATQFLICVDCNKVIEIRINHSAIRELEKNVENAGFQLVMPQLEMNCICNDCAAETT